MKKLKLCGLTRPADVTLAAELGADLFGFVLAPSPRQISFQQLTELVAHVPSFGLSVAVMVNPCHEDVEQALNMVDRVQFHGSEPPDFCRRYGSRGIKAFRIRATEDLEAVPSYDGTVGGYLFDSFVKGVAGGTGHSFPWAHLHDRTFAHPALLAGGINASNVAKALTVEAVCGIDVSSGVESSPGLKDPTKVRELFRAAGR